MEQLPQLNIGDGDLPGPTYPEASLLDFELSIPIETGAFDEVCVAAGESDDPQREWRRHFTTTMQRVSPEWTAVFMGSKTAIQHLNQTVARLVVHRDISIKLLPAEHGGTFPNKAFRAVKIPAELTKTPDMQWLAPLFAQLAEAVSLDPPRPDPVFTPPCSPGRIMRLAAALQHASPNSVMRACKDL